MSISLSSSTISLHFKTQVTVQLSLQEHFLYMLIYIFLCINSKPKNKCKSADENKD